MRFLTSDLPGEVVGDDVAVDGAAIDSRLVKAGQLFVPVVAERDGHQFIGAAIDAGAAAYLTARSPVPGSAATAVVVDDTGAALAEIGRRARARLPDQVVGITGSSGKTSTKDLLGAVLARRGPIALSERSHNNELGVPLTLANGPDGAWAAVVEMGARGPGHIRWLCDLARPTVGVVTNVSLAHTEFLGTLTGVARAKAELVEALPAAGTAVLNADDERVELMKSHTGATVLTFGVRAGEVRATDVSLDADLRPSFTLQSPWGRVAVRLDLRGAHQASNAAAAAAAALTLGADLAAVAAGLAAASGSPWRMEVHRGISGAVVLNDAYNANPASTEAALRALAAVPLPRGGRRVAVLGPMLELGPRSDDEHRRVARLAGELGVDVVAVGTAAYGVPAEDDPSLALATVGEGDAVLVKASRAASLERLADRLLAGTLGTAW